MPDAPFGDCKRAKLHLVAQVQGSGALIAIDKNTHLICACSENVEEFLGKSPDELIGHPWQTILRPEHVTTAFLPPDAPDAMLHQIQEATINAIPLAIANHSVGNTTLVEFERYAPEPIKFDSTDNVAFLRSLAETDTVEAAARLLMKTVAAIIRFDRVMLYKFLPGWHGEVIAEATRPDIGSFIGLRFPETDLPANARLLYLRNWKRAIDDIAAPTVRILQAPDQPLDLTYSQIRAVHPAHVQYLKNIGTRASFSLSIVSSGRLWGLIACHHLSPKQISFKQQALCEQLSRMTSIHVSDMDLMLIEKRRSSYREAKAEIRGALRAQEHAKPAIGTQLEQMRTIFKASEVWAYLDGESYYCGKRPDDADLKLLKKVLLTFPNTEITACGTIPPELASYPELVRHASGLLYIPLPDGDFLVLLRPEQIETVNWAGKPQTLDEDANAPLTPRASFQKWSQLVRGASDPWHELDIEAGAKLRELLIEYIEEIRLEGLALHDQLTGLANRHLFERKLAELSETRVAHDRLAAVYMLDLDRFKPVNDTMGHAAGDALLVQVAGRLKETLRESDTIARLGGDEFAVIQYNLPNVNDAEHTAQRILAEIRRPYSIFGKSVEIGISIGLSIYPVDAITGPDLVNYADLALYQAKDAGRNCFRTFNEQMSSESQQREAVRVSLLKAFERDELTFLYQPIVQADGRAMLAFEAFSRWRHPEKGLLRASEFMPLIEQNQLGITLAEWGIRSLIQQGKTWRDKGLPLVPISLNISAPQFLNLDVAGLCSTLVKQHGVDLHWFGFDLDEAALRNDFQRAAEKIDALHRLGVQINVDHFGEGAIALRRVVHLPINLLKIPSRLFEPDTPSTTSSAISYLFKVIGNTIRAKVVATQIEADAVAKYVTNAGIQYLQGDLISPALDADEVETILRGESPHFRLVPDVL